MSLDPGKVASLQTRDDLARASSLAEYIRAAREDALVLNVEWDAPYWPGVGYFVKQAHAPRGSLGKTIDRSIWLDPVFIDFAKAYVKDQHLANPGESRSGHIKRLQTLRLIEATLLDLRGAADPLKLDPAVFDAVAVLARQCLKGSGPYRVGAELQILAATMVREGVLPAILTSWSSPNQQPKNNSISVDAAAQQARQDRLPDHGALYALAEIFNRDLDPADERLHRDIVITSAIALLMSAPSRGQEVFNLPSNLVFEASDKLGKEHMGLRLSASKGFGAYIKWVWSEMAPVAEKAIERLMLITEEARSLARHLEDPATQGRFYRHANCPAVADDEPLTSAQAGQALGYNLGNPQAMLINSGLSTVKGAYTLQSLWDVFVLPNHRKSHPHFPYVSAKDKALGEKGGLRFSQALFCLRRHQLNSRGGTSPVMLWMPKLADLGHALMGSETTKSIFTRYGYVDADGKALKLRSHQVRHLINTEAQRVGLSDEQIAHWSGRRKTSQNAVYDHRTTAERVEQTREAVEHVQSSVALVGADREKDASFVHGQWLVKVVRKPRSLTDIDDIQPQLTGLKTLYGECHHDWAFAPCEGFVKCLDCSEHACIKGSGEDAQLKLDRLKALHRSVLIEVEKAKRASQDDVDGQEWLQVQERYAAKVDQLVSILESEVVPDGSVIRTAAGQSPTHLQRALRGLARQALVNGTEPKAVMEQMLSAIGAGPGSAGLTAALQVQ